VPHPKVKISDDSGNAVGVTSNALDVNIAGGASIDIGDVDMFLDGGTAVVGGAGAVADGVLRVTLASDDAQFGEIGAAAGVDGNIHAQLRYIGVAANAISGAIGADGSTGPTKVMSIGGTVAIGGAIQELQCDTNGQLMVEAVPGSAGFPVQITDTSFAVADGNALGEGVLVQGDDGSDRKNIHVDASSGNLQVDVLTAPSTAVTNAGTFAVQSTLQAGSAAIGKLAANSGVDIGDVDITSIAAGDNNIGNVDIVTLPASTNTIEVVGDVAENANAAGNPVLVGGRYDSSDRTLGNTDVGAIALSDAGYVRIDWEGGILQTKGIIQTLGEGYNSTDRYLHTSGTIRNDTLTALSTLSDGDWAFTQVDAQGALYTTHGMTGMVHGTNTDVDATAEQLDGSTSGLDTACKRVDLQASSLNTGIIYVGGADTIGPLTGGMALHPGDFYSIDVNNLNDIWVEASVANQRIDYIYYT
jgi:hypothetical protein